ncbi:carboxymuconolactone decarboxylase family protein [Kiloniella sp.]|uniref:carboxymuconolactone decarboxylase family protein n=1 Tax=Kiloniella sp. TaxID=1938587 RepID=UPI003B01687E
MNRVNIYTTQPAAYEAMFGLEKYLKTVDLPELLVELIKTRASQMNGCAYCIQLHSKAAQNQNETVDRLLALPAWRESPMFTEKERSALALTEEVTLISRRGVSDEVYRNLQTHFNDEQIAQLIMTLTVINAWNRIAVTTHAQ